MSQHPIEPLAPIGVDTLAEIAGMTTRHIYRLMEGGVIPKAKKGVWPTVETLKKLVAHYREMSADNAAEMDREKLRKMTADADNSQMEAAKTSGQIILAEDAEAIWGDRIVAMRQLIEHAAFIPEPDRKRLLAEIAALRFEANA